MRRKTSLVKYVRKKLVAAEKKYKTSNPYLAKEARIAEDILNYPSSSKRFYGNGNAPSFLDKPNQLKGKRIRKFVLPELALNMEINTPE